MSEERQRSRMFIIVDAARRIRARLGAVDTREAVEEVRIAALASLAETRGLWRYLVERGLATEAQHQDYLDKGAKDVRDQLDGKAAEIYVEGAR